MDLVRLSAYVDFRYPGDIRDVAALVSDTLFGGIPFTGFGTGIRDEVPAAILSKPLLGFEVILQGGPNPDPELDGYTLEIEPLSFPWDQVGKTKEERANASVRFSGYMRFLLEQIPGLQVIL